MSRDTFHAARPQRCLVLVLLFLSFGGGLAYGDDAKVLSFREYLEKVIELRSQLKSYDLTVMGIVRNAQRAVILTDGKAHIVTRVPQRFTFEMAVDTDQRVQIVARKEWYRQVSADNSYERVDNEDRESEWLLNIRVGDWQITRHEQLDSAIAMDRRETTSRVKEPPHFDPKALGLAMGEYYTGGAATKIFNNYLDRADSYSAEPMANGLVRYHHRGRHEFVVDPMHGYWPISQDFTDARFRRTFDLTIEKVHGEWLPVAANVVNERENVDLKLQWHSINQPVPNDRFSFDGIEKRYNCSIRDQRSDGLREK